MKFYFTKGSCSFSVHIIINEIGLDAEYEAVNLQTKKTASGADFLKINPKASVPALLTKDNEILTENAVIMQYLADTHKATWLLPPVGDFKRYRVLEWVNFVGTELHKSIGPLFNPDMPSEIKNNFVMPLIKKKFAFVNKHLQDNKFLMGDQFTLGDAYLFVMLMWAVNFKIDLNEMPNLSRYYSELKKRESIQKTLKAEGIISLATA